VPWFKPGSPPHQTARAMVGARPGDAVLVLGSRDAGLAAAVALVTGLNGRTLVVDRDPTARARIEIAARNAGALVDFEDAPVTALPVESGAFDVAVVDVGLAAMSDTDRRTTIAEAFRVLRPAGRVIVIQRAPRTGLFGAARDKTPALAAEVVQDLLREAGGRAVRQLADVDGAAYFETRRP
jgi:ubiquinone/menaquinone biosynthesis C-methylase UbiE